MLALDENGWLYDIEAILTGYLPSADHVAEAVHAIMMVQAERNDVCVSCAILFLGDDPGGLYIDEEAATAVRNRLIPIADLITPNRFELEWLTGKPVKSLPQALEAGQGLVQKYDAVVLANALPGDYTVAMHDLIVFSDAAFQIEHYRPEVTPYGIGDLLAALHLGHKLNNYPPLVAFARATAGVQNVLDANRGADDLPLQLLRRHWVDAKPLRTQKYFV